MTAGSRSNHELATSPEASSGLPSGRGFLRRIRDSLRDNAAILLAFAVGAALRSYQLPGQIPFGDEWHSLRRADTADYLQILTGFGFTDYSIPVTVYFKVLFDTIGFSEFAFRAPFFVAGVLTPLVIPVLLRPVAGRTSATLLAWLLAVSPVLVFFARTARPYAITLLLGFAGVLFLYRWWTTRRRGYATLYVVLIGLTAYLQIVDLPFILAPLPVLFLLSLAPGRDGARAALARLLPLGLITALVLLAFLGPPLLENCSDITGKANQKAIPGPTVAASIHMMTGVESRLLAIILASLALVGMIRLCRRDRHFAVYMVSIGLVQVAAVLVVRPMDAQHAYVSSRYMLPALPVMLLLIALGLSQGLSICRRFLPARWNLVVRATFPVAFCAALFMAGPLPHVMYRPNNALSATLFLRYCLRRDVRNAFTNVPAFYDTLGRQPPATLAIVEAPFRFLPDHVPLYQVLHRQRIVTGAVTGAHIWGRPTAESRFIGRLHLPSVVDVNEPEVLAAAGLDLVIFHTDLPREVDFPLSGCDPQDLAECIRQYREWLGTPVYEDDLLVVFALPGFRSALLPASRDR